ARPGAQLEGRDRHQQEGQQGGERDEQRAPPPSAPGRGDGHGPPFLGDPPGSYPGSGLVRGAPGRTSSTSPSRPPGTGRPGGAGRKPSRCARAREGAFCEAVTARISAPPPPSTGCASTAVIASLARPRPC